MGNAFSIEPAAVSDAEAISSVLQQALQNSYPIADGRNYDVLTRFSPHVVRARVVDAANSKVYVARRDNRVSGVSCVSINPAPDAKNLEWLAVLLDEQGVGIGSALLKAAEETWPDRPVVYAVVPRDAEHVAAFLQFHVYYTDAMTTPSTLVMKKITGTSLVAGIESLWNHYRPLLQRRA